MKYFHFLALVTTRVAFRPSSDNSAKNGDRVWLNGVRSVLTLGFKVFSNYPTTGFRAKLMAWLACEHSKLTTEDALYDKNI